MDMKKNINIELIRIVAAFLVIATHTLTCGGILDASKSSGWNYDIVHVISLASMVCVNLFALVSGYIASKTKHTIANILFLYLQVVIDYLLVCLVMFFVNKDVVTLEVVLKAFFPIVNNNYWYYTAFVGVSLVSSFVDFSSINKKYSVVLTTVILVLGSFFPTFINADAFAVSTGYNFAWIFMMFIVGKLLKNIVEDKNYNPIIFLILYLLFTVLGVYIDTNTCSIMSYLIVTFTYFPVCAASICLFLFMLKIRIPKFFEKPICFVSSFAFSSYLIHVQRLTWVYCIDSRFVDLIYHKPIAFIVLEVGSILLVYLVCVIIDLPRYFLFKKIKLKSKLIELENRILS